MGVAGPRILEAFSSCRERAIASASEKLFEALTEGTNLRARSEKAGSVFRELFGARFVFLLRGVA